MSERLTPWWVAEGLGKYAMTDELITLRARVAKLEAAHRELAKICWEWLAHASGGSLEGGELQDILVKHGVLVKTIVEKPCSEWCNCEDNDAVFPTTCYRLSPQMESGE